MTLENGRLIIDLTGSLLTLGILGPGTRWNSSRGFATSSRSLSS